MNYNFNLEKERENVILSLFLRGKVRITKEESANVQGKMFIFTLSNGNYWKIDKGFGISTIKLLSKHGKNGKSVSCYRLNTINLFSSRRLDLVTSGKDNTLGSYFDLWGVKNE